MGKVTAGKRELQKRHKDAIEYALARIRESGICPYITGVLLYGSCARQEQKWGSDVDLFVILDDGIKGLEGYKEKIIMLKGKVSDPDINAAEADVKFVIGNDWETDNGAYYRNVIREGISIWR